MINCLLIVLALVVNTNYNSRSKEPLKEDKSFTLSSPAFDYNMMIPARYTCQGENINPPLKIYNIPKGTKSLALVIDDPDSPVGTWTHWVVFNIPPTNFIRESSVPGRQAQNTFGRSDYGGPCPPVGTHRYFFKIYALDMDHFPKSPHDKRELEFMMYGHVIATTELIGLYQKSL